MKKGGGKIVFMGILSLLIAIGTLIGAAVLADINVRDYTVNLPDDNYSADYTSSEESSNQQSSAQSSEESQSSQEVSSFDESFPEQTEPTVETGIYTLGADSIVIVSGEAGFVEGNINCGGITMEFSGQTVDGTLVATGTDSLNNTVEITLVFEGTSITATSRPIIQYEEAIEHLTLSGVFSK